jgi:hypothetical protein
MTEAMVPKRSVPGPRDPQGTYPDVSVEPSPERDADGTVTTVFTSMAEAMVPKRGGSVSPAHSPTSPAPPSMRPLTDQDDEQELLVDDDFEELFEGEIELIE